MANRVGHSRIMHSGGAPSPSPHHLPGPSHPSADGPRVDARCARSGSHVLSPTTLPASLLPLPGGPSSSFSLPDRDAPHILWEAAPLTPLWAPAAHRVRTYRTESVQAHLYL